MAFTNLPNNFEYRLMGQVSALEMWTLYVDEGQLTHASIKGKISNLKGGWEKWPRNKSLPAHLQENYSRGDDHLILYVRSEKPTAYRSRPSLSNPRSTNDIVRAVLRANPTQLRSAANRDPTIIIKKK